MFSDELLHRLAVALSIGLLVGLERGWRAREEAEGERAAGFRTFALSGLLGGICAALVPLAGPLVLAAGLLAFSLAFAA
ncbi:MAG TPA: MgtC/SapB family protein, partial [Geminicoccus sp.]|uniref:MgtC/SapB family protein n=1 Tax=Geminicoccus sp. TaxID=2024832 RepID=UPI002CE89B78